MHEATDHRDGSTGLREQSTKSKTKIMGQVHAGGDFFAGFAAGERVKVFGQVVLTSPVTATPACRLEVMGQLIAPAGSEAMLAPAIAKLKGQAFYYPADATPRLLLGNDTLGQAFFEALDGKEMLINCGRTTLADDVRAATLRQKLHSIINLGVLRCSDQLVPAVQVLCRQNGGKISSDSDGAQ